MGRRLTLLALSLAVLAPCGARAAPDDPLIAKACSDEADRLGLHGPERFDFRARCKGHGALFAQASPADPCREVIVQNGIAGRAGERIKGLQGPGAAAETCRQVGLMKAAETRAIAVLAADPRHCGYTPGDIDALRAARDRPGPPCPKGVTDPGL